MRSAGWVMLSWVWVASSWGQVRTPEPVVELEAETALSSASDVQLDPEMSALLRAQDYLKAGRRVEALTELRAILKRDVHHVGALTLVATTLAELGRQRDAIQLFEKLSVEHAQDYAVLNNLAWLQATAMEPAMRNPERAIHLARRALLLAPSSYSVWSTMSEAYYRNGQYDKAYRAAQQAMLLAQEQKAEGVRLAAYDEQLKKCREAVHAFSLLDP